MTVYIFAPLLGDANIPKIFQYRTNNVPYLAYYLLFKVNDNLNLEYANGTVPEIVSMIGENYYNHSLIFFNA